MNRLSIAACRARALFLHGRTGGAGPGHQVGILLGGFDIGIDGLEAFLLQAAAAQFGNSGELGVPGGVDTDGKGNLLASIGCGHRSSSVRAAGDRWCAYGNGRRTPTSCRPQATDCWGMAAVAPAEALWFRRTVPS